MGGIGEWVKGNDMESEAILLCGSRGLSTLKSPAPPCLPSLLGGGGTGAENLKTPSAEYLEMG